MHWGRPEETLETPASFTINYKPFERNKMRISTLDPISMNDVKDTQTAPYVIDGDLKIYFESEANKNEYLDIPLHSALNSEALNKVFDDAADSPITGSIN